MSVELIRKATCDRCGRECYNITETTFDEGVCEQVKVKRKHIVHNAYRYTEVAFRIFDSRFGESGETTFVLCDGCVDVLGKWLTPPTEEGGE